MSDAPRGAPLSAWVETRGSSCLDPRDQRGLARDRMSENKTSDTGELAAQGPTVQRSDIQNPKYRLFAGYFSESLTIFNIVYLGPQALMKYYEKSDQPSLPTL